MTGDVRAPSERECTQCGRTEAYDESRTSWRVDDDEGDVYCVHSWDITGSFTPIEK